MYYERRERRGGRGFDRPRQFTPKPVEVGKEYDVEIIETSRRGEGIARIEGLVCFVPQTKPGDHVRVKITRISRRFAEAEVVTGAERPLEEESEATEDEETPQEEGNE
jgi:predicted RNA-binding protein with TRAM domain